MPPGSPNRAPIKRDATFLEPFFHYISQFCVNGPSPRVPQWDPYGEKNLSTEPSTSHPLKIHLSLRVTIKGTPFMFPNTVPMERDIFFKDMYFYLVPNTAVWKFESLIVQNFELLWSPIFYTVVCPFRECFVWIGMRQWGWWVSFPHSPYCCAGHTLVHFSPSPVKFCGSHACLFVCSTCVCVCVCVCIHVCVCVKIS